jgi:hypothetical protein
MHFYTYTIDAAAPPDAILSRLRHDVVDPEDAPPPASPRGAFQYQWFPSRPLDPLFVGRVDCDSFRIWRSGWVELRGSIAASREGSRITVRISAVQLITICMMIPAYVFLQIVYPKPVVGWGFLLAFFVLSLSIPIGAVRARRSLALVVGMAVAEHRLHLDPETR